MNTDADGRSRDPDAVLAERARILARRPGSGAAAETLDALEFRLADGLYAVETAFIREVLPLRRFSPLPSLPPHVLGIMNVRGRIWAVVDTRILLGLPAQTAPGDPLVILLESGGMEFGLTADGIVGTRRIPLEELATPAAALCRGKTDYIRAVTPEGTIVVDAMKMLSDPALAVRDGAEG